MLAAVKRLVGVDRDDPPAGDPAVQAAISALAKAKAAHDAELTKVQAAAQKVAQAQAAFDLDGSEPNADAVLDARRVHEKAELFAQRTQRAIADAEGVLRAAELARDERELAAVAEDVDGAGRTAEAIVDRYASTIIEAAIAAGKEIAELEGKLRLKRRRRQELEQRLGRQVPHPSGLIVANDFDPMIILKRRLFERVVHHPDGRKFAMWLQEIGS